MKLYSVLCLFLLGMLAIGLHAQEVQQSPPIGEVPTGYKIILNKCREDADAVFIQAVKLSQELQKEQAENKILRAFRDSVEKKGKK